MQPSSADTQSSIPPTIQRYQWYDITTDLVWRQITTADIVLLNAAREAHGLPRYTFVTWERWSHAAPVAATGLDASVT